MHSGKPAVARSSIAPTVCRRHSRICRTRRTSRCVTPRCSSITAWAGTRNNRGQGRENGSVEPSYRYLKEAVDQALMLRGHRDFADLAAYDEFLREIAMRCPRRLNFDP